MIELSCEGKFFLLEVRAYEFPSAQEPDDANWLVVEVEVADGRLCWKAKGAFLRAHELISLYQWLDAIENNKGFASKISFTEGELAFSFESEDELVVRLDFGLHPRGSEYDYANDGAFSMRFHISNVGISSLKRGLEEDIKRFPIR